MRNFCRKCWQNNPEFTWVTFVKFLRKRTLNWVKKLLFVSENGNNTVCITIKMEPIKSSLSSNDGEVYGERKRKPKINWQLGTKKWQTCYFSEKWYKKLKLWPLQDEKHYERHNSMYRLLEFFERFKEANKNCRNYQKNKTPLSIKAKTF